MLSVRIEVKGDKKVIAQLNKVVDSFKDWKPELKSVGEYLKKFYENPTFETEGGIFGARWQPLNPVYAMYKATRYPGRGILERTGDMRRGYILKVYSSLLELVNTKDYASRHQEGIGVPERVLISVDEPRKKEAVDIFKKGAIIKIQKALG